MNYSYINRVEINKKYNWFEVFLKPQSLYVKALKGKRLSEVYSIMYDSSNNQYYIHHYEHEEPDIDRALLLDNKIWLDNNLNRKDEIKRQIKHYVDNKGEITEEIAEYRNPEVKLFCPVVNVHAKIESELLSSKVNYYGKDDESLIYVTIYDNDTNRLSSIPVRINEDWYTVEQLVFMDGKFSRFNDPTKEFEERTSLIDKSLESIECPLFTKEKLENAIEEYLGLEKDSIKIR